MSTSRKTAKRKPLRRPAALAWWADESVPDLSHILAPYDVDVAPFTQWLGSKLGIYRGTEYVRSILPTDADRNADLTKLAEAMGTALRHVRAADPTSLMTVALRGGHDLDSLLHRLKIDLSALAFLALNARKPAPKPAKRGRPNMWPRDVLLADVTKQLQTLGLKRGASLIAAQGVLAACDIDAPEDERTLRRKTPAGGAKLPARSG